MSQMPMPMPPMPPPGMNGTPIPGAAGPPPDQMPGMGGMGGGAPVCPVCGQPISQQPMPMQMPGGSPDGDADDAMMQALMNGGGMPAMPPR